MILFLDACVVIYWMETAEPFYSRFMAKLRTFYQQDPRTEIAVSRLSHLECLVKPLQADDQTLLNNYRAYFTSPGLRIVELNSSIMEQAAVLRANYRGLRTPDAIQAACALSLTGEVVFLTGDVRFAKVPELRIVRL